MISMLFLNKIYFFPYFAIFSDLFCATYVSLGGGASHMLFLFQLY